MTDDTQLARELLQSIVRCRRVRSGAIRDAAAQFRGLGPADRWRARRQLTAARQLALGTPWYEAGMPAPYAGNGAAMRAGPLGLLYGRDPRDLARVVCDQARVTHQDARCAAGALAIAAAAAIAARRERVRPVEFLVELSRVGRTAGAEFANTIGGMTNWVHLPPDAAAGFLRDHGARAGGWCRVARGFILRDQQRLLESVRLSAGAGQLLGGICIAIAVGGDTDTLGAMTGDRSSAAGTGAAALPSEFCACLDGRRELARG